MQRARIAEAWSQRPVCAPHHGLLSINCQWIIKKFEMVIHCPLDGWNSGSLMRWSSTIKPLHNYTITNRSKNRLGSRNIEGEDWENWKQLFLHLKNICIFQQFKNEKIKVFEKWLNTGMWKMGWYCSSDKERLVQEVIQGTLKDYFRREWMLMNLMHFFQRWALQWSFRRI